MSNFEREMTEAVKDAQRTVFLELVRSHPEMTLAELSKLSRGQFSEILGLVTVGDLIFAARQLAKSGGAPSEADEDEDEDEEGEVDTRTAVGRREFDTDVLEFIRTADEPVSATEIRAHTRGTSLQVRKAVARLIEAEVVTWQGRARGTRYSAV